MGVVVELERLGGVAERATLIRLTSRRRVARAIAAGDILAPSPSRLVLPTAQEAILRAQEVRGVVSHLSAAAAWGWELKTQPTIPDDTVPKHRRATSRAGLHFADLHRDDVVDGVTGPDRTLVDCLRILPFDEALTVADSALRNGFMPSRLAVVARSARGPGSRAVRRVAGLARSEAANPFESVLRALALDAGLDVEP